MMLRMLRSNKRIVYQLIGVYVVSSPDVTSGLDFFKIKGKMNMP